MKILLRLSFVGTNYAGYQLQKKNNTIAGELNKAAKEVFGFDCNITGCSRTDSGVHAKGYAATLEPKDKTNVIGIPVSKIPIALNMKLPYDISILSAIEVPDSFHPRYSVKRKEYVYRIHASVTRDPFLENKICEIGRTLDIESLSRMREAAKSFIGTYDFRAFMAVGSKIKDCTRTVYDSFILSDGEYIEYHISANGFLYNMVRIIVGTLLYVGYGKIQQCDIKNIILSKDRKRAGPTAKACGLYLNNVIY